MFVNLYSRNCAAQRNLPELTGENPEWTARRREEQGECVEIKMRSITGKISTGDRKLIKQILKNAIITRQLNDTKMQYMLQVWHTLR